MTMILDQPRYKDHAKEVERTIIAMALVAPKVVLPYLARLKAEYFQDGLSRLAYRAIRQLQEQGEEIEPYAVALTAQGLDPDLWQQVGGDEALLLLADRVGTPTAIETYIRELLDISMARKMESGVLTIRASLSKRGNDQGAYYIQAVGKLVTSLLSEFELTETYEAKVLMDRTLQEVEARLDSSARVAGYQTGYADLDYFIDGLAPQRLYIVGGRTAMGKSFLLGSLMWQLATQGVPVVFVSLEMGATAIGQRLLALELAHHYNYSLEHEPMEVASGKIASREEREILRQASQAVKKLPILLTDDPRITFLEVQALVRQAKMRYEKTPVLMVDYLQNITPVREYRRRHDLEVSETTKAFHRLAQQEEIPVVLASQLGRVTEARPDKKPRLSDLKESGGIEETADVVLLLYRPGYYDNATPGDLLEVYIAKNRSGRVGKIELSFHPEKGGVL